MLEYNGKYTTANVMIDDIDEATAGQIIQMINHPAFTNPVRIMPDCHLGKGSVIGFSMELSDKVIPNVVGVDIFCLMTMYNIGKIEHSLEEINHKIRKIIPLGTAIHDRPVLKIDKDFDWKGLNSAIESMTIKFNNKYNTNFRTKVDYRWFVDMCNRIGADIGRVIKSIGTVGSGNHFGELGIDEKSNPWFTQHFGSRNFGKCICEYWQKLAIKLHKNYSNELEFAEIKSKYPQTEWSKRFQDVKRNNYVPTGMEYLEGENAYGYLVDMTVASMYAKTNHQYVIQNICKELKWEVNDFIESSHNYINMEDFIIRKGAISSYEGERMIIPFNMVDGILICEGKSNADWNYSSPHGAGRLFSRSQAKKQITQEMADESMTGIYTTAIPIDESIYAYKSSSLIESLLSPTATIIHRVKPILNIKDGDTFKESYRKKKE